MKSRLLLFDLDGTLVDTSRDITNALNHALQCYGYPILTVEKTIQLIGEGITRLIQKLIGDEADIKRQDDVKQRFLEFYEKHLTDYSTVYPDVIDTLEKIPDFQKVVISNKRENLSIELLKRLDLLKYFARVIGSDTTPERKPSPLPILYAMKTIGVEPRKTLIVGDSNYDIEAGKKAGVRTIAVTYGYGDRHYLGEADYRVDTFRDILDLLDIISNEYI
jgi:phosphoglycolate phosphatase